MFDDELIILSDLHLSASEDPVSGGYAAKEGFQYDAVFARFLDHLLEQARRDHHSLRILILGDFFDFFHTDVDPVKFSDYLPDTSEKATQKKMVAIFESHHIFFNALVKFVSYGFHIDIVPGNHDLEFMRPTSQRIFKQYLSNKYDQAEIESGINFVSWIYHIPGVLYAEHGHQYHDINAITTLLTPYKGTDPDWLEMPIGAHFDTYLHQVLKILDPSEHAILSPIKYAFRNLLSKPYLLLKTTPLHIRFSYNIVSQLLFRASPKFRQKRRAYQANSLLDFSKNFDIPHKTIMAIDNLSGLSNKKLFLRIFGKFTSKIANPLSERDYLFKAATKLYRVLEGSQLHVPFYVFGHSHQSGKYLLGNNTINPSIYLNSGSWVPSCRPMGADDDKLFPYVRVLLDKESNAADASLMAWNDTSEYPEPIPFV